MTDNHRPERSGPSGRVCPSVLWALADQVGEGEAAAFMDRFIGLWPQRCHRLHRAVNQHDAEAGLDAALSLSTAASMVGASSLGALASRLHEGISSASTPDAWRDVVAMLDELDQLGNETISDIDRLRRSLMSADEKGHG